MGSEDKKAVCLSLSREVIEMIDSLAREKDMTKSAVVSRAIRDVWRESHEL